jgi:hypothetical protein
VAALGGAGGGIVGENMIVALLARHRDRQSLFWRDQVIKVLGGFVDVDRLQTTDPAHAARVWHRADVRVTEAAPWVVAVQFNGTELVSRRVHDFRYVRAFGTLIDQLWIH